MTNTGALRTRDSNKKPNKINKNGHSAKYIHAGKNPGKNQPPNSNPLLPIQVPKSNEYLPVRHLVVMYSSVRYSQYAASCTAPKYWDLPQAVMRILAKLRGWGSIPDSLQTSRGTPKWRNTYIYLDARLFYMFFGHYFCKLCTSFSLLVFVFWWARVLNAVFAYQAMLVETLCHRDF